MSALLGLGLRGIEKALKIPIPPLGAKAVSSSIRLSKDLKEATEKFMKPDSLAREVLGSDFVDHFGMTRLHEIKMWEMAVTEWEVKRYMETV